MEIKIPSKQGLCVLVDSAALMCRSVTDVEDLAVWQLYRSFHKNCLHILDMF